MNYCIIEIKITKDKNEENKGKIHINLLHDGEIDEEKSNYIYFTNDVTKKDEGITNVTDDNGNIKYKIKYFEPISIDNKDNNRISIRDHPNPMVDSFNKLFPKNQRSYNSFTFYLVRHGQALHNTLKGVTKNLSCINPLGYGQDTNLTEDDIKQAKRMGKFLSKYLRDNNIVINYFFSSDLIRTR